MKLRVPLLPSWLRWIFVVAIAGFIFYVSIVTTPPETIIDEARLSLIPLDKWRHFVAYAVFGYTLAYATIDWELDTWLTAAIVIGTTIIYGIGIEFGQSLVPERYFSIGDAYANAFGVIFITPWYLVRSYLAFTPFRTWIRESSLVER